jgi:Kef-type K+ transport system membrane component KefB
MLEQMRQVSSEQLVLSLLIQIALIIAVARVFAVAFRRVGQPAVVGEIAAGLVLGPSVLGRLFPDVFNALFHPALGSLPVEASDLLLGRVMTALAEVGLVLLLCGVATNLIGIFAVFGAFMLGAVLSGEHEFRDAVNRRLRDLVTAFFLPVFFAYTGLRTRVDSLATTEAWLLAAAVCGVAGMGKFGGCGVAAWLGGRSWRESACVGCMMNTRGLMELIVANLGKELGVIPDSVYCTLVLMALVTTLMTTPLLLRLVRGTELEGLVRQAGWLGGPYNAPGSEARAGHAPSG